jgi:Zn-dependent peptidase ImmA (M78 family)/DNA-binding XRE family transcriptional regulator
LITFVNQEGHLLGDRIRRARAAAGLSLRALGDAVGVSQTAIAKYEADRATPSSTMLLALARACGVGVEYFLRPDSRTLDAPEYRKRARLGKKSLQRITADVVDQAERYLELLELYPQPPIPPFQVPDAVRSPVATYADVERVATDLRDAWRLGQDALPDLTATLEERGLLVLATPVDDRGRFDGLAATVDGVPLIVVGADWPGDRQRFTLAHELGHRVLGGRLAADLDEEPACNRFAGAFLVPEAAARAELGDRRSRLEPAELHALKLAYGLSMHGWVYRAKDLGILSEASATRLFVEFSTRGWRKKEPGDPVLSERPALFPRLVLRAVGEDLFGESKGAELLAESLDAFRARRRMVPMMLDAAHQ